MLCIRRFSLHTLHAINGCPASCLTTHLYEGVEHLTEPLGFTTGEELIKDDLSSVSKISELCFPEHKGVGVLHAVSELVAKHTEF